MKKKYGQIYASFFQNTVLKLTHLERACAFVDGA
jgi:hypothetical protein